MKGQRERGRGEVGETALIKETTQQLHEELMKINVMGWETAGEESDH